MEYEYKGHTITIDTMEYVDGMSPRDWDNLGVMHCAHRNYNLGDEETDPTSMTIPCPFECEGDYLPVPTTAERSEGDYRYRDPGFMECPACDGSGEQVNPVQWAVEQGATVVLGLYLYDHSGITMSASTLYRNGQRVEGGNPFTCRWDSGMVGIMFDTPETRKMIGTPPELIEECLHGEVQTYDDYLTGDVYYYSIDGPHCDDACHGYYLDHSKPYANRLDDLKAEAEACVDSSLAYEAREVAKIRSIMAL